MNDAPQRANNTRMLIVRFSALLLGVFFVVSGIGKLMDVEAFSGLMRDYGLGFFWWIALFVPPVEILLGLALAFGINNRRYALLALAMLMLFTIGFASAYFGRGVSDCGCFGAITLLKTSPMASFVRNILLMLLSITVWRLSPDKVILLTSWQRASVLAISIVLATASGVSWQRPLMPPRPLLGKQVASSPLRYLITDHHFFANLANQATNDSLYLLFFFGTDCSDCWNMTENVKAFVETNAVSGVYGITTGDSTSLKAYQTRFYPNFPISLVSDEQLLPIISRFPTVFIIKNGIVQRVFEDKIPSPHTFRRHGTRKF